MVFKKGQSKIAGRKKGSLNKFTTLKQAFINAFNGIGGEEALKKWARDNSNRTDFYKILSKMLPQEIVGGDGKPLIPKTEVNFGNLSDEKLTKLIEILSKK